MPWLYPLVRNCSAFSYRSGVFRSPSRVGSSPSLTMIRRTRSAIVSCEVQDSSCRMISVSCGAADFPLFVEPLGGDKGSRTGALMLDLLGYFRLLRFDPGIRACNFDREVRDPDVQRLAVGGAAVLRRNKKRARLLVA